MKIGIVCYPTYGGSGIVATELGMDLAERGHEVHFISTSLPARLDITLSNIYFHKVNVETYPLFEEYQPYSLALSTIIVNIAQSHGLDLLHVHYAIPHAYAAYFAKQMLREKGIELPIITTLHGTDITLVGNHPAYKPAVEFSINHSDKVTAVSESLKKETYEFFSINNEIEVIPNFIDNEQYQFDENCGCRNQLADRKEKVIIHVSNLRKVKRLNDVVKVFYEIQKEIPAKLIIVGEGPQWEIANNLINELGISEKVKALGKINDLYNVLCSSDLFLLPSEKESFGLAALEAMAARVPVISSNAGGIPEVNIDGETGYVLPVGDVKGMAEKAIELLKDDAKMIQFKENAKNQALKFDKKNILPMYEELYLSVLEKVK
ncbi:N-acetyl-alpha-D-glucosaminyl L-malate synthase BshA [Moheibacter sediminis]|uniref:N-acetyl-alpha-D-glucosaminyl L-malate synthase BshA n=1 Tax=Moheibacter sediminis TaxID=1434700 RepID=A0A1W2C3W3_9FLAO|nr:N-acetyl-alpha-D-glucosaminyl L-malate synthase BshA [Moheibacter sediminis]SMC79863.1 N-acetyl-alpha-D-glucosaminyl L-malate synthase BshA [Moheibacter sediminis]